MVTLQEALERARKQSLADGRARYVYLFSNTHGWKVSTRHDKSTDCYWTNGKEFATWNAFQGVGRIVGLETILNTKG